MKRLILSFVAIIPLFLFGGVSHSLEPRLNFSDLDSGPSSGLDDGLGEGTIVTLWGNNLGSAQGSSQIKLRDVNGTVSDVAYVYYWKNANGELPGGPANLYQSHRMQEIAVSIPNVPNGLAKLYVTVNGVKSNELNFTVRDGAIKWVAPSGNNNNSCSFSSPCGWINGDIGGSATRGGLGNEKLDAGDIVYSRGVQEPDYCSGGKCAGMYLRTVVGTKTRPVSLVAYPGTRPKITSENRGVNPYRSDYINISKYHISVGYKDPATAPDAGNSSESNYHIKASKGRYVGNFLDEKSGTCFNGWSGAFTSGSTSGSGVKIFGNHFFDLGCDNTSRYQHTLYMSVRDESSTNVEAWEIGWNHLQDNKSLYGIHNYDEQYNGDCGNVVGTLSIHDNYIINQKGAGIHVSTRDRSGTRNICWEADIEIYNNVLINNGLGPAAEDNVTYSGAMRITGDMGSSIVNIYNNTIYGYSDASARLYRDPYGMEINFGLVDPEINVWNNLVFADGDYEFINTNESFSTFANNVFYTTASNPTKAVIPSLTPSALDDNTLIDPQCSEVSGHLQCAENSPLIAQGVSGSSFDIFGNVRAVNADIGAYQLNTVLGARPLPPTDFTVE